MKIAITIINWNGENVIGPCLNSILNLKSRQQDSITIIVIDNGSVDSSIEKIKGINKNIIIIENNTNMGVPHAFNQCFKYAENNYFDYILITNNDVIFDNLALVEGIDALEKYGPNVIVTPTILDINFQNIIQSMGCIVKKYPSRGEGIEAGNEINDNLPEIIECDYCGIFIMKVKELNCERFCEGLFGYWEDVDYCLRMKKRGYRIISVRNFKIWHHGSYTIKKVTGFFAYYGTRNRIWYAKKYTNFINLYYTWIYTLVFSAISIFLQIIKFNCGGNILKYYLRGIIDGTLKWI
ncbi:MAG: glycosyltransferase family 2 protein [Methanomassiliicoccales archaeon]